MAELKIGGSDVKIMYGSQEIGGAHKSGDLVFSALSEWSTPFQKIHVYTEPFKPKETDEYVLDILYKEGSGLPFRTYNVDFNSIQTNNLDGLGIGFRIDESGVLVVNPTSVSFGITITLK